MKIVAIDIGSYSVKVAEIRSANQGIQLFGFQEYPLSTEPTKDKDIEILEILRRIDSQYINDTEVTYVGGLPAHQVSVHRLAQPPAPRFKILESIPYVLADLSPLDPEEALHDIRILKSHPNGHDILAIAAKKENISKALQKFTDAGIEPTILTVQGLTANNIFENIFAAPVKDPQPLEFNDLDFEDEGPTDDSDVSVAKDFAPGEVVLNLGHTSTTMLVRKDGGLAECREISWGGHDLVTGICNEYKIHYREALQMLHKSGILILKEKSPSPELNRLSDALKKAMVPLLKELQISLLEVKSKYTLQVRAIGLLGGTSRLRNIGPYLTQNLQIACNPVSSVHQFPEINFKNEGSPISHMIALGMGLEGVRKPRNPALDLRKGEFSLSNENLKVFFERWSYSLQLMGLAFIAVLTWSILRSQWSYQLSELALDKMKTVGSQVTGLPKVQANIPRLNAYIRSSADRMDILKKLQNFKDYKQASYYLRELHARAPGRKQLTLDITSLNINNNKMIITGQATSTAQLLGLEDILKGLSSQSRIARREVTGGPRDGATTFMYEINIRPLAARN